MRCPALGFLRVTPTSIDSPYALQLLHQPLNRTCPVIRVRIRRSYAGISQRQERFVKLLPYHFLGNKFLFTSRRLKPNKPGKYSVFVEYDSPFAATEVPLSPFGCYDTVCSLTSSESCSRVAWKYTTKNFGTSRRVRRGR